MRHVRAVRKRPAIKEARRALKRARLSPFYPLEFRSQFGEDALIWFLCGGQLDGFFIEAGAFDGYEASVTYGLECIGWRGLLVEAHPDRVEACRTRRARSRVVHAALGDAAGGTTPFLMTEDGTGGMYSHVPGVAPSPRRRNATSRSVLVPRATVDELLRGHAGDIDVAVFDLEGSERAMLAGFDLRVHRPKLLLLEDNPRRPDGAMEAHMAALPYTQLLWLKVNRVYVRTDLVPVVSERLSNIAAEDIEETA